MKKFCYAVWLILFLAGCASSQGIKAKPQNAGETSQDVQSAVGAVAESISQKNSSARYCPVCGRHYSFKVKTCPVDSSVLKDLEQ